MTTREAQEFEELRRAAEEAGPETVSATVRFLEAARSDEAHALLAARTLTWLTEGVGSLNRAEARGALASTEGERGITEMIERLVLARSEESPLVRARLRGIHRRGEILEAGGGFYNAEEAAAELGRERTAVDKRRERGTILALPRAGEYVYPVWQFDDSTRDGLLPGFKEVLASFGVRSPWMRAEFMLAGHEGLGGARPVDVLRAGEVEPVQRLAASYGDHGGR